MKKITLFRAILLVVLLAFSALGGALATNYSYHGAKKWTFKNLAANTMIQFYSVCEKDGVRYAFTTQRVKEKAYLSRCVVNDDGTATRLDYIIIDDAGHADGLDIYVENGKFIVYLATGVITDESDALYTTTFWPRIVERFEYLPDATIATYKAKRQNVMKITNLNKATKTGGYLYGSARTYRISFSINPEQTRILFYVRLSSGGMRNYVSVYDYQKLKAAFPATGEFSLASSSAQAAFIASFYLGDNNHLPNGSLQSMLAKGTNEFYFSGGINTEIPQIYRYTYTTSEATKVDTYTLYGFAYQEIEAMKWFDGAFHAVIAPYEEMTADLKKNYTSVYALFNQEKPVSGDNTAYVFRKKWVNHSLPTFWGMDASADQVVAYNALQDAAKHHDYYQGTTSAYPAAMVGVRLCTADGTILKDGDNLDYINSARWGMNYANNRWGSIGIDNNGRPWGTAIYDSGKSLNIYMPKSDKAVTSISLKKATGNGAAAGDPTHTTYSPPSSKNRIGYGIDAWVNDAGKGFVVASIEGRSENEADEPGGVMYYTVSGYPTDAGSATTLGAADKMEVTGIGTYPTLNLVDAYHFWIDGNKSKPVYVQMKTTDGNKKSGLWATLPVTDGEPQGTVGDFWLGKQRYLLACSEGTSAKIKFTLYRVNNMNLASYQDQGTPPNIDATAIKSWEMPKGKQGTYFRVPASAVLQTDENLRQGCHLYMSASGQGVMAYFMEEAPAFFIKGTNGFPTAFATMGKVEPQNEGTLHFTNEITVGANTPTFAIKHKNIVKANLHTDNTLGKTGLTNVQTVGCSLSGTNFTPTMPLVAGNKIKITLEYADNLQVATPTKAYKVVCEQTLASITYELNGGIASNPATYAPTTATFTLNNPTKEGCTFVGWTGSNGNEPQTSVTIEQGSTGNKNFVANWQPTVYQIVANALLGGTVTGSGNYQHGSTATLVATPNAGFSFVGWYENGTEIANAEATYTFVVNKNRTLEARFSPTSSLSENIEKSTLIWSQNRTVIVKTIANNNLSIYNLAGKQIYQNLPIFAHQPTTLNVPTAGIYIVKIGNETHQVVVK